MGSTLRRHFPLHLWRPNEGYTSANEFVGPSGALQRGYIRTPVFWALVAVWVAIQIMHRMDGAILRHQIAADLLAQGVVTILGLGNTIDRQGRHPVGSVIAIGVDAAVQIITGDIARTIITERPAAGALRGALQPVRAERVAVALTLGGPSVGHTATGAVAVEIMGKIQIAIDAIGLGQAMLRCILEGLALAGVQVVGGRQQVVPQRPAIAHIAQRGAVHIIEQPRQV